MEKITLKIILLLSTAFLLINKNLLSKNSNLEINNEKEIIFGQSIYETGSLETYGKIIKNAIQACFNTINEKGGINGKQLRLVSMDDKGDPVKAEKNIENMLNKYKIDMFLGNMGTRNILKVLPLIRNQKIAMLFPWGGDETLRSPDLKNIINGPGLITPQIEKLVEYIVESTQFRKIAIFYSDSSFYKSIEEQTIEVLKKYQITPIQTASFNRFTMDINSPANKIMNKDPKVVISLCTSLPAAKLISSFFEKGHYGTSFFGIDSTFFTGTILKAKGAKFYYTSPVPDPLDTKIPIVKEYQENLKNFFPQESFNILSLTYYICAKIIVEAMKKIPDQINKESVIEQIAKMKNFDLGGFIINFNPTNRHAFGENISIIKG